MFSEQIESEGESKDEDHLSTKDDKILLVMYLEEEHAKCTNAY